MYHRKYKRVLALCLAVVLCVSLFPLLAASMTMADGGSEKVVRHIDFEDGERIFTPTAMNTIGASTSVVSLGDNERNTPTSTARVGVNALKWVPTPNTNISTGIGWNGTQIPKLDGKNPTSIGFWVRFENINTGSGWTRFLVGVGVNGIGAANYRGRPLTPATGTWADVNNQWTWIELDLTGTAGWLGQGQTAISPLAITDADSLFFPNAAVTGNASGSFIVIRHTAALATANSAIYIDDITLFYDGATGADMLWDTEAPVISDASYSVDGVDQGLLDGKMIETSSIAVSMNLSDIGSGIDLTKVTAVLNGVNREIVLVPDDDGGARLTIPERAYTNGDHTIVVTAYDLFGFAAKRTIVFSVNDPDAPEQPGIRIVPFNPQRNADEAFVLDIMATASADLESAVFTLAIGAGVNFTGAVFHNAGEDSFVNYNRSNRQLALNIEGTGDYGQRLVSLNFEPIAPVSAMTVTAQAAGMAIDFADGVRVTMPTTPRTVETPDPELLLEVQGSNAVTAPGASVYLRDELNRFSLVLVADETGRASLSGAPAGLYTLIAVAGDKSSAFVPFKVLNEDGSDPESIIVPGLTVPKKPAGFEVEYSERGYPVRNFRTQNGFALDFNRNGLADAHPTLKYEIYRFRGETAGALVTPVTTIMASDAPNTFANMNHVFLDTIAIANAAQRDASWFNIHAPYTYVILPIDHSGVAGEPAVLTISDQHSDVWREEGLFEIPITPLKHESRGVWLTTISGWPTSTANTVAQDELSLINFLDRCVALNINLVYFQVKGMSDAFWDSSILPWSARLTGTQGRDPGWDPLGFMVQEAHKRNIEVHAWCNPFRVTGAPTLVGGRASAPANFVGGTTNPYTNDPNVPNHVGHARPEWLVWDNTTILDPGIPEARKWVIDGLVEMVERYDIDGLHFDDYFYYEQNNGSHGLYDFNSNWRHLHGVTTFEQFNTMEHINGMTDIPGFDGLGHTAPFANTPEGWLDWRRNNIDLLIVELSQRINNTKPWVQFSISPGGIYANSSDSVPNRGQHNGTNVPIVAGRDGAPYGGVIPVIEYGPDPAGSDTRGGMPLKYLHGADVVKWAHNGWIDVLTPQVYWSTGFYPIASHMVLTEWWRDAIKGANVLLTIGMPNYKLNGFNSNDHYFFDTVDPDNEDTANPTLPPLPMGAPETVRYLRMAANMDGIDGTVAYSSTNLFGFGNAGNNFTATFSGHSANMYMREYAQYAIAPPITWKGFAKPDAPAVSLEFDNNEALVTITPSTNAKEQKITTYALYAFEKGAPIDIDDVTKLVTLIRADTASGNNPRDPDPEAIEMIIKISNFDEDKTYVLTAFDRLRNESDYVEVWKPPTAFNGTSPSQLNALLASGHVTLTTPGSGGYGIASGATLVVPAGRMLFVDTILNVRRDATLRIEGTVVILEGGRLNSDGHATPGVSTGTIIIAEGGKLVNEGYVEIAQRSTLTNLGRITNNGTTGNLGRFEVRAGTEFTRGVVDGTRVLTLHRDVIIK